MDCQAYATSLDVLGYDIYPSFEPRHLYRRNLGGIASEVWSK